MDINLGISGFILPEPKLPDLRDPIKDAFEGIFSPVGKLLKSGISTNLKKAVEPLLTLLFEKLKSFLGDLAFVASELLSKTESMAKRLIDQILQGASRLRAEVEGMVGNILIKVQDTVQQITQAVTNNLVKPFFQEVDALRKSLVEDVKEVIDYAISKADQVIDKGDRILTATIDTFRNEALKVLDFFPWDMPWDKDACRFELHIQGVPGPQLATGELYELLKCRRLKRFDEESELKNLKVKVLQTLYADLQDQAWHLACAARDTVSGVSSALKIEAIEDWIEFGRLHQLWNQFKDENMGILDALNQKVQELETKIAQFEAKSAQLDDVSVAVQKAQQTADNAHDLANNAHDLANNAHDLANNAQTTGNQAISAIGSLQQGIQNGSIIAQKAVVSQKALMLRARNDNHWLRCNGTDSANHDCFGLWTTDNKWYNLIRVGATGALPRGSVTEGPAEL